MELDQPTGKNDGSMNGDRYFKCRPNCGIFVLQSKVKRCPDTQQAAKKSASIHNIVDVSSGAEYADCASGSGSISLATSGASGSSEAEASSPSPHTSPGTSRRKMGTSSSK